MPVPMEQGKETKVMTTDSTKISIKPKSSYKKLNLHFKAFDAQSRFYVIIGWLVQLPSYASRVRKYHES